MAKSKETEVQEEILTPEEIIENAKKEAARILSEAEERAAGITGPVNNSSVPDEVVENEKRMQELVPVHLFYDGKDYKDDLFIRVNNRTFQIQRGVDVMVPRFVKEIIDSSLSQEREVAKLIEAESSKAAMVDRA